MTKYGYVPNRISPGVLDVEQDDVKVGEIKPCYPEGFIGVIFCFKTKRAARKWYGKNVELHKFSYEED